MLHLRESRSKHKSSGAKGIASSPSTTAAQPKKTAERAVSAGLVITEEDRMLKELAEFLESEDGIFTP